MLGSSGNVELLSDVIIKCEFISIYTILVVIVARSLNDKPLLFPCGNLHKETLPQQLHEAGIGLHSITCYETCPHSQLDTKLEHWLVSIYLSFISLSRTGRMGQMLCFSVHLVFNLLFP